MCKQGRYVEALAYCEQALELSREVEHVEASALTSLGLINYRLANNREALKYYEDSLRARRAKGDYFLQADVMTQHGDTYRAMGDVDVIRVEKGRYGNLRTRLRNPCVHEHTCLRFSLHWPDPAQHARIAEIRDKLVARITEADV